MKNTKFIFQASVKWTENKKGNVSSLNKPDIEISTPPQFEGYEGYWSPEELFLSSINSCIMTTFFYFADKFSLEFVSYHSEIEGEVCLDKGSFVFSLITVRPIVTVKNIYKKEKVLKTIEKSHKYCLVSASVKSEIKIEPKVNIVK